MIDTDKYVDALRAVSRNGLISHDAAIICVNLAVREQDQQAPAADGANANWMTLAHDLEGMLTDARGEAENLRSQIRDQDATIQAGRAENARLIARVQELSMRAADRDVVIDGLHQNIAGLAAQVAALTNPNTLTVQASPGAFGGEPQANGSADPIDYASLVTVSAPAAPSAVSAYWANLDAQYTDRITKLTDGTLAWTELPVELRRAVAIYVIGQLATDGSLTMAQFDHAKPGFMPSAGAIASMFGLRWSEVVTNAVRIINYEVAA